MRAIHQYLSLWKDYESYKNDAISGIDLRE